MFEVSLTLSIALLFVCAACAPSDDQISGSQDAEVQRVKNFAPEISPDGRTIAFYSYRGDRPDLYLLNLDTREETRLTHTKDFWEIEPKWAPDGKSLLYGGGRSMQTLRQRVHVLSTGEDFVFGEHDENVGPAEWMPNGEEIVFLTNSGTNSQKRFSILKRSGEIREFDTPLPSGENVSPNVSPNGGHIAFRNKKDGRTDIFVLDIVEREVWRLTDNAVVEEFLTWTRDGEWVLYTADLGDNPKRVFGLRIHPTEKSRELAIQLSQGPMDQVQFFSSMSADGKWLYYDGSTDFGFSLYRQSMDELSATPEQLTSVKKIHR